MKFFIEQIALCPRDRAAAIELLSAMGAADWVEDTVSAEGVVNSIAAKNVAELAFNYEMIEGKELEILHYKDGPNWMEDQPPSVSHFGMHCTARELTGWCNFFHSRGIEIAQEVFTNHHTNPAIAGKRYYHYLIFNTRPILGVDIKFIVRNDVKEGER